MAAIAAVGATSTTLTTFHLARRSSLAIHRISLATLSLRLHASFGSQKLPEPENNAGDGFQVFLPWLLQGHAGDFAAHALPAGRSLHAVADGGAPKKVKGNTVEVKKKKKSSEEPRHSKAARRFYNERFREPPQRLAKVLAAAGVASRRSSEELIFQGKVTVNGSVRNTPQTRVDPARDIIYVNGNRLPKKLPPKVYLALNKPKGYICSAGQVEFKSVLCLCDEFLKRWDKKNSGQPKPRLFTVGRLDVATTGLIIVTNDGDFAQKVSHPSSNLTKEYIATVDGGVHTRHLVAISCGTVIDGAHCTPESVELLPQQPGMPRARIRIVVNEGRNHEVRELVKNAGLEIHSLKRTRIGRFRLPADLGLGKLVELKENDLKALGWEK